MSFDVDPAALTAFAKALQTDQSAAAAALKYLTAHSKVEEHGLAWTDAYEGNEIVTGRLGQALAHLESVFKVSAAEINKVATEYQRHDKASAQKLDASFPNK
jgi:uncharacterized protein YukE